MTENNINPLEKNISVKLRAGKNNQFYLLFSLFISFGAVAIYYNFNGLSPHVLGLTIFSISSYIIYYLLLFMHSVKVKKGDQSLLDVHFTMRAVYESVYNDIQVNTGLYKYKRLDESNFEQIKNDLTPKFNLIFGRDNGEVMVNQFIHSDGDIMVFLHGISLENQNKFFTYYIRTDGER